jgi:drug/metabolite transporter (DMT)-like permease
MPRVLTGVLAAVIAPVGYGVSSVLQALAARRSAAHADAAGVLGQRTAVGGPTLASTIRAALTFLFIVGVILDVIGFVGGVVAARSIPLFLAQTIISANLVVTAVLGLLVLGIPLRPWDWVAITTVVAALGALGLAAGSEGGHVAHSSLHWGVLVAAVTVLSTGQVAVRRLGSRGAVAAGLFAGLLFGDLAIAARITNGLDPWEMSTLVADPAAWTLIVTGAGGFYLHTVALQLGSVNGATAALMVGETVLPGIIGVWLLGDTSRSGLAWLAALEFILAIGGAVAVSHFGARAHPSATG